MGSGTVVVGAKCRLSRSNVSTSPAIALEIVNEVNGSLDTKPKKVPSIGPIAPTVSVPPPTKFRVNSRPAPSSSGDVSHVPPAPIRLPGLQLNVVEAPSWTKSAQTEPVNTPLAGHIAPKVVTTPVKL